LAATILCADDDRHFCQILARAFTQAGYRVETAHDGESALDKIKTLSPDLVTLDVMLPRRDGFSVLEALRQEETGDARTPVLLLSGCTFSGAYAERARVLGADAVLRKPVRLEELLEAAASRLRGENRVTQVDRKGSTQGVALKGRIGETAFPVLLHDLHGMRAKGVLQIQSGKRRKQLQLRDGIPVAVRSNLVNETLGHMLVASGKITVDVLHESILRVKRGEGLQGQILRAMHMLDEEDLAAALRNQAEEKLYEIFAWQKGTYRFHPGTRLKGGNTLALRCSPAQVILRGFRERLPLQTIDTFLAANAERAPVPGESPFYRFQDVGDDPAIRDLADRLDGSLKLSDLAPMSEDERRTLHALLTLELREPKPPMKAAAAETATAGWNLREVQRHVQGGDDRVGEAGSEEESRPDLEEEGRHELAELAERFRDADAFGILSVSRMASDEEIRTSYAELAKQTHPDRLVGASGAVQRMGEEVFGAVSEAYEKIGDYASRMAYIKEQRGEQERSEILEEGQRALRAELAFQKGEALLRARRYEEAHEQFAEAVETYPEEGEYLAYQGWAYYLVSPDEHGRISKAAKMVQQGRKLAPDREKPYLFLGRLFKAAGRPDTAERMFTRAIQLDPDQVEALRELRLMNMRRQKSRGIVKRILRRS
jgi:CheY-like chemotaxis protein/tetratricopeptide (TPR) repeat protein